MKIDITLLESLTEQQEIMEKPIEERAVMFSWIGYKKRGRKIILTPPKVEPPKKEEIKEIQNELKQRRIERQNPKPIPQKSSITDYDMIKKILGKFFEENKGKAYSYDELARICKFRLYDQYDRKEFEDYLDKLQLIKKNHEGITYYYRG